VKTEAPETDQKTSASMYVTVCNAWAAIFNIFTWRL